MIFVVLFSLAIAGQAGVEANGDDLLPPSCEIEWRSDACRMALFDASLGDLPVTSIDEEAASGAEIYRARQLTAWARPLPVVSFVRRPGQPPMVVVDDRGGGRMSAPIGEEVWSRVATEAQFADRDLAPLPQTSSSRLETEEVVVCADGSTVMAEMANAPAYWGDRRAVRRKLGHSCDNSPVVSYVDRLAELAVSSLPSCAKLKDEGSAEITLRICLSLRGDTFAAADLTNQVGWRFVPDRGADTPSAWLRVFGGSTRVRLDWAGLTINGDGDFRNNNVANFMIQQTAQHENLRGYIERVHGASSTRVETTGSMEAEGPDETRLSAPFRQVWLWDDGGLTWKLDSWTVEAFKAVP